MVARIQAVAHPDGRPYPWLSSIAPEDASPTADEERYLIYQPFAGMCNRAQPTVHACTSSGNHH